MLNDRIDGGGRGGGNLPRRHVARGVDGATAAQELVEHHAEAVDVAPLVGLVAPARRLFGAHVGGGAEHGAFSRQVAVVVGEACQAEVGQAGPALAVEDHVGRLQVAVVDAVSVARGRPRRPGRGRSARPRSAPAATGNPSPGRACAPSTYS